MRATMLLIPTLKEDPADADIVSHRLMLRAGMIRRVAAGIYTWLPLGLRVIRKIEAIVREEMNRIGAQELLLPFVQPADLWKETGRWDVMGPEMLRVHDRHGREEPHIGIAEVHRPAHPFHRPGAPCHDLRHHRFRSEPQRECMMVPAVRAHDVVGRRQHGRDTQRNSLLALSGVGGSPNQALREQFLDPVLEDPDLNHSFVPGHGVRANRLAPFQNL